MSVADQLGLWDETSERLALADQRWGEWAAAYSALTHCCGVRGLRSWLPGADNAEADEALHALATLAAVDGGDDIAAAAALAWALMPGACTLANRLRTLTWHIDEIVAAQLWVEVRTFPWRRLRRVAANVLEEHPRGCSSRVRCEVPARAHGPDVEQDKPRRPLQQVLAWVRLHPLRTPGPTGRGTARTLGVGLREQGHH
jgi:hypothetical protein